MFRLGRTVWMNHQFLKFAFTARNVLRNRGRLFHNTGKQRLTQRCQKCFENDGDFAGKQSYNGKYVCESFM
jgi:hypothetical protein